MKIIRIELFMANLDAELFDVLRFSEAVDDVRNGVVRLPQMRFGRLKVERLGPFCGVDISQGMRRALA